MRRGETTEGHRSSWARTWWLLPRGAVHAELVADVLRRRRRRVSVTRARARDEKECEHERAEEHDVQGHECEHERAEELNVQGHDDDARLSPRLRFLQLADEDLSPPLRFIHQLSMLELAAKWVSQAPTSSSSSTDAAAMDQARFRMVTYESLRAMADRGDLPEHMRTSLAGAASAWQAGEHSRCVDALSELRLHCTLVLQESLRAERASLRT